MGISFSSSGVYLDFKTVDRLFTVCVYGSAALWLATFIVATFGHHYRLAGWLSGSAISVALLGFFLKFVASSAITEHNQAKIAELEKTAIREPGRTTQGMFTAKVINVMIASPGDVDKERDVIRETIHRWNALHAEQSGIVLLPIGWDTHSWPMMGDRAQAIINKQVLDKGDLLVAVFWTRLGTPTGEAPSGTVEEIRMHIAAGKPAMIYFSNTPVRLDSVDPEQYEALQAFKKECQKNGLIDTYDSTEDFKEKFERHLAQIVSDKYSGVSDDILRDVLSQMVDPDAKRDLSPEAQEILRHASQDRTGMVMCLKSMDGFEAQTNGHSLNIVGNPREEARCRAALEELEERGLLREQSGGHYRVTKPGYDEADRLWPKTS